MSVDTPTKWQQTKYLCFCLGSAEDPVTVCGWISTGTARLCWSCKHTETELTWPWRDSFFSPDPDTCMAFDTCYHRRANRECIACLAKAKPRAKPAVIFIDVRWQHLTLAGLACLICCLYDFRSENCTEMTWLWLVLMCSLLSRKLGYLRVAVQTCVSCWSCCWPCRW